MSVRILIGDTREQLRSLPDESVHCVVTSPPYFGLRDYGVEGQIGLEGSPAEFIATLVGVFREVRRVLRDDGTLWLNLGDSYNSHPGQRKTTDSVGAKQETNAGSNSVPSRNVAGLAAKQLLGIPWRVALALQQDGWYLRQDIIWHKPNPMPESVRDRCTKAHEYIFLLAKSERYYFDADAIAEPSVYADEAKYDNGENGHGGGISHAGQGSSTRKFRKSSDSFKREGSKRELAIPGQSKGTHRPDRQESNYSLVTRNKRSVWTVPTKPFKEAHFATFPPALIEPCILAGCPVGGTVLDPFGGAGTTGLVADRMGRDAILIELNPTYADMAQRRIVGDAPLFAEVV